MLLTIEKVMILKDVDIFSTTPEEDLIEVASIVEEIDVKMGEEVIKKGDIGTSMYIIIEGEMKVHDGDKELVRLGNRKVFGELAALNPEPRSASITALRDSQLFRLEQGPLYDLMAEHVDVVKGIMHVLCNRMRQATKDIGELKKEVSELKKNR